MRKCVRRGDPQRRSYWEAVVQRWREGGQSVREYCRTEGLRESAFYFWRRKLAAAQPTADTANEPQSGTLRRTPGPRSRGGPRRSCPRIAPRQHGAAAFLPVQVVMPRNARAVGRQGGAAEAASDVEIVLACGRTVRVGAGFDRQTLRGVLAVLEDRPC